MSRLGGKFLALFLLLVGSGPLAQTIPGIPDQCCGYRDCRRAKTALLEFGREKARVAVDGVELQIPAGKVIWSKEGWYCSRQWPARCQLETPTEACARCVAIEPGMVELPRPSTLLGAVTLRQAQGHGERSRTMSLPNRFKVLAVADHETRKLLLPVGRDCGACHQ